MNAPLAPSRADPQARAADPRRSAIVTANAGSGKTETLVRRVARLLLAGAAPGAILCVTYTRAAAAEMQRRLFATLGDWAVMADDALRLRLAELGEPNADLAQARALFARALETPGGLKIQTIHAFCEGLLRRFPLEAGLSPAFTVLDDVAAADLARRAEAALAEEAAAKPGSPFALAYARLSVALDWRSFGGLFADFAARRGALCAWLEACEARGGHVAETWRQCGFATPSSVAAIAEAAVRRIRWGAWGRAVDALARSGAPADRARGAAMAKIGPDSPFAAVRDIFCKKDGGPRKHLGARVPPPIKRWLAEEQARRLATLADLRAARIAEDTVDVLTVAAAWLAIVEDLKAQRRALDFADIIERAARLIDQGAAWVLYKLDGSLEHVLLDEAQDTAPEQWAVLRGLTAEFFAGRGAAAGRRTFFAVGDEKQSIFSFQGAAPEQFRAQAAVFGRMVGAGGRGLARIRLDVSRRSCPQILQFVDAVAAQPGMASGLFPAGPNLARIEPLRHRAHRADNGCVEIWPLEERAAEPAIDLWAAPGRPSRVSSANRALAARIAREIRLSVERGDEVGAADGGRRACRWDDFLILVRRRNALFHEIIRALKREGAPAVGADRFQLAEHGVRDDLMTLGRVALFPADDLALAELLRGPFCDVSEESLFALAHGREGSLWRTLNRRAGERPEWGAAVDLVRAASKLAAEAAPLDFYLRLLARLDAAGRSLRQRLMTRMGLEGEEALLAFLDQALQAEGRGVRDLESLLDAFERLEVEIRREPDSGGQVRVMTVHGAKGLEAPVVILPDTATRASDQAGGLIQTAKGAFLFAPRAGEDCPPSSSARDRRLEMVTRESARLLYVALTRARDRLVIAGVASPPHLRDQSWRALVEAASAGLVLAPFDLADGRTGLRFGPAPTTAPAREGPGAPPSLPPWLLHPPAPEPPSRVTRPSPLAGGAAPSPLATEKGLGRWRRGELIHALLQRLPEFPAAARRGLAAEWLAREADLGQDQRDEIAQATLAVTEEPRFAAVFGPGSRAEVAIAGRSLRLAPGAVVSGRIDRLLIEPTRILAIDFKTNRPAPKRIEAADPAYIRQLALYWAVLAEIWPDRAIETALLWTDGPALMPIPENLLREALEAGGAIG